MKFTDTQPGPFLSSSPVCYLICSRNEQDHPSKVSGKLPFSEGKFERWSCSHPQNRVDVIKDIFYNFEDNMVTDNQLTTKTDVTCTINYTAFWKQKRCYFRCHNTTVTDSVSEHSLWIYAQYLRCCPPDKYVIFLKSK